jgi:ATP-dependent protease Clp ATPase subunit
VYVYGECIPSGPTENLWAKLLFHAFCYIYFTGKFSNADVVDRDLRGYTVIKSFYSSNIRYIVYNIAVANKPGRNHAIQDLELLNFSNVFFISNGSFMCNFLNSPIQMRNVRRNAARSAPAHLLSKVSKSSIARLTEF